MISKTEINATMDLKAFILFIVGFLFGAVFTFIVGRLF
jgi:hypothetical protein